MPDSGSNRIVSFVAARAPWLRNPRQRAARFLPIAVLFVVTVGFRILVLVNAAAINSDMAVVGLQAMHILRGEWSWNLWGAAYQSAVDPLITAIFFAVIGHSPFAFQVVPVAGHFVMVALTYAVVRSKFARWHSVLLSLLVVLTPMAVNYTLTMVQRQACTIAFLLSVWLLNGASQARRPLWRFAMGGWFAVLSVYCDLYGLQWLPAVLVFGILCAFDQKSRGTVLLQRIAAVSGGAIVGVGTFLWLRSMGNGSAGQLGIVWDRLEHNFRLLWDTCLPWALAHRVFHSDGTGTTVEWTPPAWFHVIQLAGAFSVALGILFARLAWEWRRTPWIIRRLGIFGFLVTLSSLGAFLVSVMPVDHYSTRYLAPIILVLPFSLAPAAYWLGERLSTLGLAPYLVSAAVGGWMSTGLEYRTEAWPGLTDKGRAEEERQLAELLRSRGVSFGAAQYWVSYRLTFLFEENPVFVPLSPGHDRYPPYREQFDHAKKVAFVFDPTMPFASAEAMEQDLVKMGANFERVKAARYVVLIQHR